MDVRAQVIERHPSHLFRYFRFPFPSALSKWLPGYDLIIATGANSANPFGLDSISLSHLNSQILLYERMIRRSAMMTSSLVSVGDEESVSV